MASRKKSVNCKDDEEISQKTGRCIKKCKEDQERNEVTQRCIKIKGSKKVSPRKASSKKVSPRKASSKKVSPRKASSKKAVNCKDDEEISQKTGRCIKKCKEDQERNEVTQRCIKIKGSKKVSSKPVSPKKASSKKPNSKPVSPKKVGSKKVGSKKVGPKKVSSKTVSPKKVSPKKVSSKPVSPKKVSPKKPNSKPVSPKKVISNQPSNNKECIICADTFSNNKFISCPYCNFECCKNCMETFLMNLNDDTPRCMNSICKKSWSLTFVADNFSKDFFDITYHNRRIDILFEREKSLLPETQLFIQERKREAKIENIRKKLIINKNQYDNNEDIIKDLLKDERKNNDVVMLRKNNEKLLNSIRDMEKKFDSMINDPKNQNNKKNVIIMKCPADNCRGFVNNRYVCGLCNVSVCKECRIIVSDDDKKTHKCDKDLLASIKLIVNDSKNCPRCTTPIFKRAGCNHMRCTVCNTNFNWVKGMIGTNIIHNGIQPPLKQSSLDIRGIMSIISLEKRKKIVNFLYKSFMNISHIEAFIKETKEIDYLLFLRIDFLENKIDETKWKESIKLKNKIFEKNMEVIMILEMVSNTTTDLFNQFNKSNRTPQGKIQKNDILLENINKLYTSIINLYEHANKELSKIRKQYKTPWNTNIKNIILRLRLEK